LSLVVNSVVSRFVSIVSSFQEHVTHARSSAKHAVQTCLGKTREPYRYTPFFYSRIFEYSDRPLIWNLWGYPRRNSSVLNFPISETLICTVWMVKGKVCGVRTWSAAAS